MEKRKAEPVITECLGAVQSHKSYGFFGCVGAGCWAAGFEDAGKAFDAGGLFCGVEVWGTGVGVPGVVAGVFAGAGLEISCKTEPPLCSTPLSVRKTIANAQIMNMTAHHVVACERIDAAPRGPKAV